VGKIVAPVLIAVGAAFDLLFIWNIVRQALGKESEYAGTMAMNHAPPYPKDRS